MKYFNALYIIVSVLCIIGCESENHTQPNGETDTTYYSYFPLNVGNFWVYESIGIVSDTIIRASIIDSITINNHTYYIYIKQGFEKGKTDTLYLRFENDHTINKYQDTTEYKYIDFSRTATSEFERIPYGVVCKRNVYDSVKVGGFDSCIQVLFHGGSDPSKVSFAKGIGEIKTSGFGIAYQLVEARVNGINIRR